MTSYLKNVCLVGAIVMLLPVAQVAAHNGVDDGHPEDSISQSSDDSLSPDQKRAQEQQKEREKREQEIEMHKSEKSAETQAKLRDRSKEIESESVSNSAKRKTAEERKKTCEERKKGLETKLKNLVKNAEKHEAKITGYFDAAKLYVETNQLTDDALAAALLTATDAQAKAALSVDALQALEPTLDCSAGTVSSDVASFKAAAELARNDLRTYRQSVRAILEIIEKSKEDTEVQS